MRSKKRARLKRQRIATARKAVAAFMVIVLTVGLMPNWSAWGEAGQDMPVATDKMLKTSSADAADEGKADMVSDALEVNSVDAGDETVEEYVPTAEDDESAEEGFVLAGETGEVAGDADDKAEVEVSGEDADNGLIILSEPEENADETEPEDPENSDADKDKKPFAKAPEGVDSALADGIDFTSCRLLIAGTSDFAEGTEVLSEYKGITLTQYPSETQTRNAYLYYKYVKGAAMVAPDTDIAAAEGEVASGDDEGTLSEDEDDSDADDDGGLVIEVTPADEASTPSSTADEPFDLGAENTSPMTVEDNPLAELNEEIASGAGAGGYTVALVDTGYTGAGVVDSASMLGDSAADDNGHGTEMAGYILEADPGARIVSVKALGADGKGTVSSVYAGIEYAIAAGVDVINLSLSAWASADNEVVVHAIEEAAASGIIVVGAAGNNGTDASYTVPGCVESAFIFGACDEEGSLIPISNYGVTVDAYAIANSTSEAAARASGAFSRNGTLASAVYDDLAATLGDRFVLSLDIPDSPAGESTEGALEGDALDNQFETCTSYTARFNGSSIIWGYNNGTSPKKIAP